jgi:hypothetical protein
MKDKYWLIIVLISIIALSALSFRNLNNLMDSDASFSLPEFEVDSLDFSLSPEGEEITQEQFIDSEGRIKLAYPSDWSLVEGIEAMNGELSKENSEVLLSLQSLDFGNSAYSFLFLQKVSLEEEMNLKEIISLLTEESGERSLETEIKEKTVGEDSAVLTIEYSQGGSPIFYGKEKIILYGDSFYVLDIFSTYEGWAAVEEETNNIIESFETIEVQSS